MALLCFSTSSSCQQGEAVLRRLLLEEQSQDQEVGFRGGRNTRLASGALKPRVRLPLRVGE